MSNTKNKMEYSPQHHNISELLRFLTIKTSSEVFSSFIKELTHELIEEDKYIPLIPFQFFFNIPVIIVRKLYSAFKEDNTNLLSTQCFIEGMTSLFTLKNIDSTIKVIFRLFDFDQDGLIQRDDILLLAYHFHYMTKNVQLTQLEEVIMNYIGKDEKWSLEEFTSKTKNQNADIIFLFLNYFSKFRPFNKRALEYYTKKIVCAQNDDQKNKVEEDSLFILKGPTEKLFDYLQSVLELQLTYINYNEEENNDDSTLMDELSSFEEDIISTKEIVTRAMTFSSKPKNFTQDISPIKPPMKKYSSIIQVTTPFPESLIMKEDMYSTSFPLENLKQQDLDIYSTGKGSIYCFEKDIMKRLKYVLVDNTLFLSKSRQNTQINVSKSQRFLLMYYIHNIIDLSMDMVMISNVNYYKVTITMNLAEKCGLLELYFSKKINQTNFINKILSVTKYKKIQNDYLFTKQIGSGNYGTVFLGENKETKEKVAIKMLSRKYSNSREGFFSIEKQYDHLIALCWEIDISRLLLNTSNENIIKVMEIYESIDHVYIVMEYINMTLSTYLSESLKHKALLEELTMKQNIILQIANGLAFLQKMGVIHRDIKIENIVLSSKSNNEIPQVKLIDFGLAKVMGYNEKAKESFGTLCYMSPECITGLCYGFNEDIWALGILAYYFLKGKFPFLSNDNSSVYNVIYNIIEQTIVFDENDYKTPHELAIKKTINRSLVHSSNTRANIQEIISILN